MADYYMSLMAWHGYKYSKVVMIALFRVIWVSPKLWSSSPVPIGGHRFAKMYAISLEVVIFVFGPKYHFIFLMENYNLCQFQRLHGNPSAWILLLIYHHLQVMMLFLWLLIASLRWLISYHVERILQVRILLNSFFKRFFVIMGSHNK